MLDNTQLELRLCSPWEGILDEPLGELAGTTPDGP